MISSADIHTIERAAEALTRLHDMERALELWALALRLRVALDLPPETLEVHRG